MVVVVVAAGQDIAARRPWTPIARSMRANVLGQVLTTDDRFEADAGAAARAPITEVFIFILFNAIFQVPYELLKGLSSTVLLLPSPPIVRLQNSI